MDTTTEARSGAPLGRPMRVLLADDHQVIRLGLRATVESMPGWTVCGEAQTGREAVDLARQFTPDIVVLDMAMPELNGLDSARLILRECPETEVMILTGNQAPELVQEVFAAGVRSYLAKTDGREHLEAALRSLAAHKPYFTNEVAELLFSRFMGERKRDPAGSDTGQLSVRERQVVQLLTEGHSNKEVAEALGISVKTVETHRATVMKKLKLKSFSDLVRYAIRAHISPL